VRAAQLTNKALDGLIAAGVAVLINKVLPDALGVAPAIEANFDGLTIWLAGTGAGKRIGG